ncbi:MAG: GLPGLI family protein [Bacteroides sp.]|nr:GLPGLI family protein [Bacteroides sp.]
MRILLLSVVALTCIVIGHAEKNDEKNIWNTHYRNVFVEDTARSVVIYEHVEKDVKLNQQDTHQEMLSIGDKITTYGGYANYQVDSLYSSPYYETIKQMSPQESIELSRKYKTVKDCLTINPEEGTLAYYGKIFINPYRYFEPIPEIDWVLTDETEEIMGYECHKATAKWRGREWNAWYSDIPVNAGPWKFQGLPGLILKVEDTGGVHSICAIAIRNIEYPIGHPYRAHCKTTREKYNEAREDYAETAGEVIARSGLVTAVNGEKPKAHKRRLFYAPIELE